MKDFYRMAGITFLFFIVAFSAAAQGQGQFVRGVEKKEFSLNSSQADFYVSPKGKDSWSGKLAAPNPNGTDGPFATIERARLAVRELKKQVYQPKLPAIEKRFIGTPHAFGTGRDILVLIREGRYDLSQSLVFDAADGGERVETDLPTGAFEYHELKDCYVTYAAYPGEHPVISGGHAIVNWKKGKQGKWYAKTDLQKVTALYANGKRLTLARTPNTGYFLTDGQPDDSLWFRFKGKDIQPWKGLDSGRIRMVVRWGSFYNSLREVDMVNRKAWLKKPSPEMMIIPPKYYVENIEALMDTAGEWFFDATTKTISVMGSDPNQAQMFVPTLSELVRVEGAADKPVRNLRFYQLGFQNTAEGGKAAIAGTYLKHCEWLNNNISNLGQTALQLGVGAYHNLIKGNAIHDGRGAGIVVAGVPKPAQWADFVSDNTISYNKVTNMLPAGVGISTYNATRSQVLHNYVSQTGSYGIAVGSWPNIEETSDGSHLAAFNHVSYSTLEVDDESGIAVFGMSHGSVVRNNLVHDVRPAGTNENVGFFFQNMSLGWTVTNNIYYNLKQAEMKYCAAYPVDNVYRNNFVIEPPLVQPEEIIEGLPDCTEDTLQIETSEAALQTGQDVVISALVYNRGGSGTAEIPLYVDGKLATMQLFPVISKNHSTIRFHHKFAEPGEHRVSVGGTAEKTIIVKGAPQYLVFQNMKTPMTHIPQGDSMIVYTEVENLRDAPVSKKIDLMDNGTIISSQEVRLEKGTRQAIRFAVLPQPGNHLVSVGTSAPRTIIVYPVRKLNFQKDDFRTYCSTTAQPCSFDFNTSSNRFEITACGTDFLHAEDSYGTIFLREAISGNFVATVKLTGFSDKISEWFRAGIFVRNNLAQSQTSEKGSLGSFLMFSTTKRHGAQWDEFADGCMHNTKSANYGVDKPIPVWLKLVRQGNRFSGYYSFDGKTWTLSRESGDIPGLAAKMDIGLAGGANDQRPSKVTFEDFQIWVAQ